MAVTVTVSMEQCCVVPNLLSTEREHKVNLMCHGSHSSNVERNRCLWLAFNWDGFLQKEAFLCVFYFCEGLIKALVMTLDLRHLRFNEDLIHKYWVCIIKQFCTWISPKTAWLLHHFPPKSINIKNILELTHFGTSSLDLQHWSCKSWEYDNILFSVSKHFITIRGQKIC